MPSEYDTAALSTGRILLADVRAYVPPQERFVNELALAVVTHPSADHIPPEWITNSFDAKPVAVAGADDGFFATTLSNLVDVWLPSAATVWARAGEIAPVAISVAQEVRRQTAVVASWAARGAVRCLCRIVVHMSRSIRWSAHGAVRRRRHRGAGRGPRVAQEEDDHSAPHLRPHQRALPSERALVRVQALRLWHRGRRGCDHGGPAELLQAPRRVAAAASSA